MCRWLKGADKAIVEGDFAIEKDADLRCTRTGQVLDDLRGKSVFDLNAALAAEYATKRAPGLMVRATLRKVSGHLLGLPEGEPECARTAHFTPFEWNGATVRLWQYAPEPRGVPVAAASLTPKKVVGPLVVYVNDRGKAAGTVPGGDIEKLVKAGREVLAVDLRGWGETAPAVAESGKVPTFGVEYKESFLGLHLNRPLFGQRVWDLLNVVRGDGKSDIELVGVGAGAPVVLHVAAFEPRVKAVTLDGGLVSWDSVVRTPISHNQLAHVVPGVLKEYDLPDLAESLAPRKLTIRNPVDATGKPLTKEAAEEAYKGVREAYKAAKAEDKFTLIIDAK